MLRILVLMMVPLMAVMGGEVPAGRVAWFTEARLGGFIHWSAGGVYGARWYGEPLRNPTPYGEWSRHRNRVPRAGYDEAVAKMSVTPELVDSWVKAFRDAGFGYVVFVAKHHDGLAYWPSKASEYTFQRLTGSGVDVCAEMRKACDRHGMKLGFYYSQWQDWEHPDGWGNFWDGSAKPSEEEWKAWHEAQYSGASVTPGLTAERFARYWDAKCVPQVIELLEAYRPDLLWFDCYVPRERTVMTAGQVSGLLAEIRRRAPQCLVNSRLGIAQVGGADGVDYETLGDNEFGENPLPHPWETPATLNRSWGYNRDDEEWKPAGFFLRMAVNNIHLGGNLLVNVGPRPDGTLPPDSISRLNELAQVIPPQGAGFSGCGPLGSGSAAFDWGMAVANGNRMFLHVFEWPVDGVIRMAGLTNRVATARLLAGGAALGIRQQGMVLRLTGPRHQPVPWDTVVELQLDGPAQVAPGLAAEINGGGWHLGPAVARVGQLQVQPGDKFWIPAHLDGFGNEGALAAWKVAFPAQGLYPLHVCFACPEGGAAGEVEVMLDGVVASRLPVVGTAPDASEFRTFALPPLRVDAAGVREVAVRTTVPVAGLRLAWVHAGMEETAEANR